MILLPEVSDANEKLEGEKSGLKPRALLSLEVVSSKEKVYVSVDGTPVSKA